MRIINPAPALSRCATHAPRDHDADTDAAVAAYLANGGIVTRAKRKPRGVSADRKAARAMLAEYDARKRD